MNRRKVAFRIAAILVGLAPFVAAEATFRLLDWGRADVHDDPFVGFRAVHPLFELNEDGSTYRVARSRLGYFRPDSFAAQKPRDEFRIFCLGGSTVQGRPFAAETSFPAWLEVALQTASSERTWQVVNCGGVSYASYRLVPILEEILNYEPDLIILYTGHNEFLEDRTYSQIKHLPATIGWPLEMAARTRSFVLLNQACRRIAGKASDEGAADRPILTTEVDAMLDYRGGLAKYHRDLLWQQDTVDHFRYNLRRMVGMTHKAGVPLVLLNPVANLRDCPPFKSEHRDGLAPHDEALWQSLVDEAAGCRGADLPHAVACLKQAMAIDDQYAELHYLLARCYDDLGMTEEARASYLQAKELDICPLRAIEPIHNAIFELATSTSDWGTTLVDVRKYYQQTSEAGIPGNYLLVDHVHPSITGHQQIANLLADELIRRGFLRPRPGWQETRDRAYAEHLGSLDDLYFAKGQQRLEMLRRWSRGKSRIIRSPRQSASVPAAGPPSDS